MYVYKVNFATKQPHCERVLPLQGVREADVMGMISTSPIHI